MIQNIFKGLNAYTTATRLITKLKLWKFFAIPIIISLVTASIIGFSAYGFSDNIGHWIAKVWPWEWGAAAFETVANFLGGILILAIGLVLYKHIVMALSAPFMSPVSEKIEAHLQSQQHQHRDTSFMEQLWRGIRINLRNLVMELVLTIPIFLLGFIPLIGSIASPILLFLMQSYYAGFGNMDYTLERHFDYQKSISFVKNNRGYAIGNGMVFMGLLLIPVIGIILVLPLSVTAATTQTVHLLDVKKPTDPLTH